MLEGKGEFEGLGMNEKLRISLGTRLLEGGGIKGEGEVVGTRLLEGASRGRERW